MQPRIGCRPFIDPMRHCQDVGHSGSLNERKMGSHVRHYISSPKGTGDVHHITDREGPEEEQMFSSVLSLTSAPDGVGGQGHAPAALPPPKGSGTKCAAGWVGPRACLDL